MPNLHEPLPDSVDPLSPRVRAWAKKPQSDGVSFFFMVLASAFVLPRPSNPGESIAKAFRKSSKGLHDGEPELMLRTIEARFGKGVFDECPRKDMSVPMTGVQKKALIGKVMKDVFRAGRAAHGKPNLRSWLA